jgi:hypothetical protein
MKIEVELSEDGIIEYLKEVARDQIWHINYTIQQLKTREDKPKFLLEDLKDHFANLHNANKMIEYHGGEPVDIFGTEVKIGYDLDGEPFNKY